MALFVYVATTQGLVQVQSIIEEDPDIDSLVCLNGSMQQLPISRDYHQFVKKGSGLIHKDFNHGSFRLDVDKPIDSGKSWQLGFYLAHYCCDKLVTEQSVSAQPQAGDVVIWATGEVKIDKTLSAVAGVGQKCQQSAAQLTSWLHIGVKVLCVLPSANEGDIEPIVGIEFLACDSLNDVLAALDEQQLEPQEKLEPLKQPKPQSVIGDKTSRGQNKWPRYKWPLSLVGMLALLSIFAHVNDYIPVGGIEALFGDDDETVYFKPVAVDSSNDSAEVVQEVLLDKTQPIDKSKPLLKALVKTTDSCENAEIKHLSATDFRFTSIRLDSLCQLALIMPEDSRQVMGIALDTGGAIPVDVIDNDSTQWSIAIPSSKYKNRDYLLLVFDELFYNGGRNPLVAQMRLWRWDDKSLSARLIQDWVKENNWPVMVYSHQLQDD